MCVQVIVAPQRRKQIQKYMLSGERFGHVKDYSIPEPAHAMVSRFFVQKVGFIPGRQEEQGRRKEMRE